MSKKEEFKAFAKERPALVQAVRDGKSTWQALYEIYDIYGEDEEAWSKYLKEEPSTNKTSFSDLSNMVKNIDMDAVQKHIQTAQKALNFVAELTSGKGVEDIASSAKGPVTPRPLNKFFED